jgi:hypothetical protein
MAAGLIDHLGQAVGAEQHLVAIEQVDALDVRLDLPRAGAERPGQDVSQRLDPGRW